MKKIQLGLYTTAVLLSGSLYAQDTTPKQPAYGDNPNLFKVLAVKTQEGVQSTAENVSNATEKGIEKVKPAIDNSWKATKEFTSEKADQVKNATRKGYDTAVDKVKATKENLTGVKGAPIERRSLSQASNQTQSTNTPTIAAAPINNQTATSANAPVSPATSQVELDNEGQPVIQRQSIPTPTSTTVPQAKVDGASSSNDPNSGIPN